MSETTQHPVYFSFGLHAHQPVGNFGNVFEEHLRDVYQPFLSKVVEWDFLPVTLHISGPLLDWLEANATAYLDQVGRLAADGGLELLLAGYYEPILPSLCREDRIDQVRWMREALQSRFGVEAKGLWLTERVWEPDLAADLVDAGVEYVLVDDRHFVAAGFTKDQLHRPFRTESCGKSLGVFAIDEYLRYFLPFQEPEDTVSYLRKLRSEGKRLAVAADDIEKFGGWPGTHEWVYERGWMERYVRAMKEMEAAGEIRIAGFSQALAEVPSAGAAYLPSASYREMEEWALPTEGFQRLARLKTELGEEIVETGDSPLIRGSHWRNFLVKYPESNRMHKKMLQLSRLCRERGDPQGARRAIGRAQCNDAYWHGVFGGLYLRHLRDTVWRNLAEAEGLLREGQELAWEQLDLDLDGSDELWVHSSQFSALVSPSRGGSVEELTLFRNGVNLANTLTRRREPYHHEVNGEGDGPAYEDGNAAREAPGSGELPPVDAEERALFVERVLPGDVSPEEYRSGAYRVLHSWASAEMAVREVESGGEGREADAGAADAGGPADEGGDSGNGGLPWLEATLGTSEGPSLEKRIRFGADGSLDVYLAWDPEAFPSDSFFTTELSLGEDAEVHTVPHTAIWRHPISTFSKSERGFDETVQGESVTVRWPVDAGWGRVRLTRS
jgi:alpha-amylase